MDRPALQALLEDIRSGQIDCVVVYKVDRLSRSLLDFARLVDLFEQHEVSFVSVTQQFNTTTSMGRLTLNILLSFAQFEREIIGERIRDKKLATARQGKYIGGQPVLGLDIVDKKYVRQPGGGSPGATHLRTLSGAGVLPQGGRSAQRRGPRHEAVSHEDRQSRSAAGRGRDARSTTC